MDRKYTKKIQEQILGGITLEKERKKSPSCIIFAVQI